jgi:hypothetical protein
MRAFGYSRDNPDAEEPTALREVSLALTVKELETLIAFLEDARLKFSQGIPRPGQTHCHLRDWSDTWGPSDSDVIVVYDA